MAWPSLSNPIGEDGRAWAALCRGVQVLRELVAVKKVVPEDECRALAVDEVGADDEGLGQTFGLWLCGVTDLYA